MQLMFRLAYLIRLRARSLKGKPERSTQPTLSQRPSQLRPRCSQIPHRVLIYDHPPAIENAKPPPTSSQLPLHRTHQNDAMRLHEFLLTRWSASFKKAERSADTKAPADSEYLTLRKETVATVTK
jgi:hypothetical protein